MLQIAVPPHNKRVTLFVEVILPLPLNRQYTYRVPYEQNNQIAIGKRVLVPFGKSKIYTGIIIASTQKVPEAYEAKYLLDILDEEPIVDRIQINFWEWMANYYLCTLGEVMQAAIPAGLKLESTAIIVLHPSYQMDKSLLNDKEYLIVEALEQKHQITLNDVVRLLGQKTVLPILKNLFAKEIIYIAETIPSGYKPRKRAYISLHPVYQDAGKLKELLQELERAPKQVDVLLSFIQLTRMKKEVSKNELLTLSGAGTTSIKALVQKGVFTVEEKIVSRLELEGDMGLSPDFTLSAQQEIALTNIKEAFFSHNKRVVLLHGVTASGKTQIYIRLIEALLATGKQILYLIPEIALSVHMIERLRDHFHHIIGVYHSRFNSQERVEVWQRVLNGTYRIVLGARSAVFLPFKRLGLVIVDEEHENSYKQLDPAPRYHARDAAIFLSGSYQAKVLLGSATPSFESYHNTCTNKYGLVTLQERFSGPILPQIEVVSMLAASKKKTMHTHFSPVLLEAIEQALARKEQVILFQNRRGYAPVLLCNTCAYTATCIHCAVSLTFHKYKRKLNCHYCGYQEDLPSRCNACGSVHISYKGFGTERIEDELRLLLPDARIARMDGDTTRSKTAFQNLLSDLAERKIDILVGTQMVAKGLDFANVTVSGIMNADSLLKYPDYRANERSFQLLTQVSGRSGRRNKQGKVIIQTYNPEHRIIKQVINADYIDLYHTEMAERKDFKYPPLYRIIQFYVKNKDPELLQQQARHLAITLRKHFDKQIVGPESPLINRIRTYFIQSILLKFENNSKQLTAVKSILRDVLHQFETLKLAKGSVIQVDVDPY